MTTILIKRYPNRKLYNTEIKRYVTLDSIAELIRQGQDVEVRDHQTGEDLTAITLSQIIFEQEKQGSGYLPSTLLANLIRTGGDTFGLVRRSFQASINAVRSLESEVDDRINALVGRGELAEDEARRLRQQLWQRATNPRELAAVDGHIESALHRFNIPSREDLLRLQSQIDELTEALETLLEMETADQATSTPDPGTAQQA